MTKTLLLTGFEPFLNFKINPTEEIVRELDQQVIGQYKVVSRVLPVEIGRASCRERVSTSV